MNWFRSLSQPGPVRRPRSCRPRLELLEVRDVPATFTVSNLDDSGAGSLHQAILNANAHSGPDAIRFAKGLHGTILVPSQLAITDDLTIRGPGADLLTVSGGGATRVFAVLPAALASNPYVTPTLAQVATSPSVTIAGLTVADGLAENAPGFDPTNPANPGFAFGGGVYNLGGTVHLDQVQMIANQALGVVTAGGAVANEFGGTLTVSRSSFANNTSGGFVIGVAGAITSDLGPASDGVTGQPTVTIERSTFTGNQALAQAGYIDGAAFTGLGGGGAILNVTGAMTISRSHFENNVAQGGSLAIPGVVSGGPGFGGAILTGNASPFGFAQSTLDVSRSTFVGNTATGGDGGAAGLPGGEGAGGAIAVTNGSAAEISRNLFHDNTTAGGAGGTDATGGNATGGAVSASGGATLLSERNAYTANTAAGGAGTGTGAAGTGRGGAIGLYAVALAGFNPGVLPAAELSRDLIVGNTALGGLGGGIYNEGDLTVRHSAIVGNSALGGPDGDGIGGGIYNLGTVELIDTLIFGNFASTSDDDYFGC